MTVWSKSVRRFFVWCFDEQIYIVNQIDRQKIEKNVVVSISMFSSYQQLKKRYVRKFSTYSAIIVKTFLQKLLNFTYFIEEYYTIFPNLSNASQNIRYFFFQTISYFSVQLLPYRVKEHVHLAIWKSHNKNRKETRPMSDIFLVDWQGILLT